MTNTMVISLCSTEWALMLHWCIVLHWCEAWWPQAIFCAGTYWNCLFRVWSSNIIPVIPKCIQVSKSIQWREPLSYEILMFVSNKMQNPVVTLMTRTITAINLMSQHFFFWHLLRCTNIWTAQELGPYCDTMAFLFLTPNLTHSTISQAH